MESSQAVPPRGRKVLSEDDSKFKGVAAFLAKQYSHIKKLPSVWLCSLGSANAPREIGMPCAIISEYLRCELVINEQYTGML